jgi:hypothetical protein
METNNVKNSRTNRLRGDLRSEDMLGSISVKAEREGFGFGPKTCAPRSLFVREFSAFLPF